MLELNWVGFPYKPTNSLLCDMKLSLVARKFIRLFLFYCFYWYCYWFNPFYCFERDIFKLLL